MTDHLPNLLDLASFGEHAVRFADGLREERERDRATAAALRECLSGRGATG